MRFRMKIRKILFVCLSLAALIGVARFCHHATHGFRLSKIRSNLIEQEAILPVAQDDKEFLTHLFQQKFHFLGRGLQSFVFESDDGKYVLKLFNNRYQTNIQLYSLLSHLPFLGSLASAKADYFSGKLLKTFKSYEIAFEEMQDKTGLLYIHLKPTQDLPQTLTIVDPLRISHTINPNQTGFLIQKKAILIYPALKDYVSRSDISAAKTALSSLVDLFFWKWDQGIADNDPLIRTNYGIIDGKAIQIDVGPLSKETVLLSKDQKTQQIRKITASLKFWLNENAPELAPYLDQELLQRLSSME